MKKRLIRVREEDAAALAILGREIWEEHYTSILGPEQVAYMVREFQSEPAVLHQMREEQYVYWFFTVDGARAGYLGVQPPRAAFRNSGSPSTSTTTAPSRRMRRSA